MPKPVSRQAPQHASSSTLPPDDPTVTLMNLLFGGSQLKEDVWRLIVGCAACAGLEGFDRVAQALGKQDGKRGGHRTVLFMSWSDIELKAMVVVAELALGGEWTKGVNECGGISCSGNEYVNNSSFVLDHRTGEAKNREWLLKILHQKLASRYAIFTR